ncbi:hypothetical protein, partial [Selenomonas ruminantium]|uniref:hypothetical protein n=1 Tax=Selenomonas ruminantium TaxID=971 RepID=UPI0026F043AC
GPCNNGDRASIFSRKPAIRETKGAVMKCESILTQHLFMRLNTGRVPLSVLGEDYQKFLPFPRNILY